MLAYSEIRQTLEQAAGRLNGRFAEADWTPIRYLNPQLHARHDDGFFAAAKVALVTPVRDGMNLVAKEFVAAQDPKDPGVLIISPMAGAARELTGALQVNPYDKRAMAEALHRALHMSLDERRQRHRQMMESLRANDVHHWYGTFCSDLEQVATTPRSTTSEGALGSQPPARACGLVATNDEEALQLEGLATSERSRLYVTFITLSYQPCTSRLDEVLVHVEVERQQRVILQHHALRLLQ